MSRGEPPLRIWRNARIAPMTDAKDWGLIEDGVLVASGERLAWVGPAPALPLPYQTLQGEDLGGALVTPGLVDAHTHLVYGGDRAHEHTLRLRGIPYEEIAKQGGGILSTVTATRAASEAVLLEQALSRAETLMDAGVTTLEIKSGYGLSLEAERRCLSVAREVGRRLPLSVQTTFLGLHALPPEYRHARGEDAYVREVLAWLPDLHAAGLIDAVDAFADPMAFSTAACQRLFEAALELDLPVKVHAEQRAPSGGAAMAARMGAMSCDHLEFLDDTGIEAMADAGSVAVLLPGAYYMLRETQRPPVARLREAGVPMALATDHNPGTSPTLSLLLMAHMGCTLFGLTPLEALHGITHVAGRALGLEDRGRLTAGARADFSIWDVSHPQELTYWLGQPLCRGVVIGGMRV